MQASDLKILKPHFIDKTFFERFLTRLSKTKVGFLGLCLNGVAVNQSDVWKTTRRQPAAMALENLND